LDFFRYAKEEDGERVLLIIPHIINRLYILDLNDDVSVIRKFCEHSFSVYMFDWGYPTMKYRKICILFKSNGKPCINKKL